MPRYHKYFILVLDALQACISFRKGDDGAAKSQVRAEGSNGPAFHGLLWLRSVTHCIYGATRPTALDHVKEYVTALHSHDPLP